MRISNELAELERVRQWIEEFGADNRLPTQALTGLLVSFDEVLSNVISYGYADDAVHEIILRLAFADGAVLGEIEDDGVPFDPLAARSPSLTGGIGDRPVGGLGIHFVKELNDEVAYERGRDRNRLRFKKNVL